MISGIYFMKKNVRSIVNRRHMLMVPFLLVFCILGAVVFFVSKRISVEMSESAIDNFSENLYFLRKTTLMWRL